MLVRDWVSFSFDYELDWQALVPHLTALEAHKAATRPRMMPPQWLARADGGGAAEPIRPTDRAQAWVAQRFTPAGPALSVPDILTIHRLVGEQSGVEEGEPGVFRTQGVRVGRDVVGGYHMGAPAHQLATLMDEYIDFVDDPALRGLPPVIHALLAHFFFDTIHPFVDGNGRTARLVTAAILRCHGYALHGTHALIRHFYNHALRYHTILHRSWQRCPFDVTAFVAFGIEGFVMELRSIDAFLKMKLARLAAPAPPAPIFRRRLGCRPAML
jgi:hypothetical protein